MLRYQLPKDIYRAFISVKYNDIYDVLGYDTKSKIFENRISLFLFAATIGFKHIEPLVVGERVKDPIHCEQLKENQLASLYSIIVNDETLGKNIENFLEEDFLKKALRRVEEYAEGGMKILCDKVFETKWNGESLSTEYSDYDIDLLRFIYEERMESPF